MIARLSGTVVIKDDPYLLIDVNGIAYKVYVTQDVLSQASKEKKTEIFTYTHVREDALELYGFSTFEDLKLFESLIEVSGVGPKTAIAIFAFGTGSQIKKAIIEADVSFFTRVPRLGLKNAQKIIIELKSKIGGETDLDLSGEETAESQALVSALKVFGFNGREISDAVRSIDGKNKSIEDQVKLALQHLGR